MVRIDAFAHVLPREFIDLMREGMDVSDATKAQVFGGNVDAIL